MSDWPELSQEAKERIQIKKLRSTEIALERSMNNAKHNIGETTNEDRKAVLRAHMDDLEQKMREVKQEIINIKSKDDPFAFMEL